jgi:pimeloyl-ACP methyl ester carboxylesterase
MTLTAEPEAPDDAPAPPLPFGRRVELPGRGITFFREVEGPPGAPTVVLLHGWIASGGLNWFRAFDELGQHFRVIAPDLRGHGRGIRSRRRFRLADCADDTAALIEHLGCGPVIVVGYSMGGPVAQLLWRRHRNLVAGLVFCATSYRFVPGARERLIFVSAMAAAAGSTRFGTMLAAVPLTPMQRLIPVGTPNRPADLRAWARAEMRRHDVRTLLEAGQAVGNFNARKWIRQVDVPTTVMVTTKDRAMAPMEQIRLALAIPDATIQRVDDGHVVCARPMFGAAVTEAVLSIAARLPATRS